MSDHAKVDPRLYTVPQTAFVLHCSIRKVWSLLSQGALTKVRVGRAARVTAESVDQFIKSGGRRS